MLSARAGNPMMWPIFWPIDNAPEAMLSLVTNSGVPAGLTQAVAADLRAPQFPYIVEAES